jgi:DNA end-binding protein Ku
VPDDNDTEEEQESPAQAKAFWSGVITFGLVSVPVSFYAANKPKPVSLRMVDKDGTPLTRQYFCPAENKPVERDDLVRGYEVEDNRYILVTDEELESLEPKKTREIDLSRFVDVAEIDPMYFERAYYLAPDGESTKAYQLLAATMERSGRAGIASFVMRGKEYIVAIIAEKGILRAETLRFHDEIRSPQDVGLPEIDQASASRVKVIQEEIREHSRKSFDAHVLVDQYAQRMQDLVRKKIKLGQDIAQGKARPEEEQQGAEIIDLMEILKKSFKQTAESDENEGKPKSSKTKASNLDSLSKEELLRTAQRLAIPNRTRMSKSELVQAIKKAS